MSTSVPVYGKRLTAKAICKSHLLALILPGLWHPSAAIYYSFWYMTPDIIVNRERR